MTAIKERQYEGGRTLAEKGGLDADMRDVATDLAAVKATAVSQSALVQTAGVIDGGYVGDPTTPSSQITGAGATTWNVDIAAIAVIVNSIEGEIAVAADTAIHDTTELVANGESCYAWVVVAEAAGVLSFESVKGTAATTGAQVAPTDAEITTGVGHANWMKLALCLINRTGDTTVTQSQSNIYREQMLGPLALALINALRSDNVSIGAETILTTKG